MSNVFDVRINSWGHMVERQWSTKDNTKIQGCLTPLPKVGDYLLPPNDNNIARFIEVEPMQSTKDGFTATIEFVECVFTDDEDGRLPTHNEITEFLDSDADRVVL